MHPLPGLDLCYFIVIYMKGNTNYTILVVPAEVLGVMFLLLMIMVLVTISQFQIFSVYEYGYFLELQKLKPVSSKTILNCFMLRFPC